VESRSLTYDPEVVHQRVITDSDPGGVVNAVPRPHLAASNHGARLPI
jgi:hypothetical protein